MYSNRSEFSQRQPHGARGSKQWDHQEDTWEKRHEPHRGFLRDGHSDSPQRQYSRDRDGRSPPRRPESSPVWDASEKKRQRYSDDEKSDHRYQYEHQKRTYRPPADGFSDTHANRNMKYRDFRQRHRPEEFENKQRHDGVNYRRSSASYREQDGRERSRDRSQERYTQIPVKPRKSPEWPSTSTHQEDRRQSAELWQNGSSKQAHEGVVTTERDKVPKQEPTKGFQRFLDVLNKGVNVDTLTKIVTQSSADVGRLPGTVDQSWTCRHASPPNNRRPPHNRSPSPLRGVQREDQDKTTPTPEDQSKCRQMQGVLQAIGMDLGFEELGQMSHRIQERLYGRKDGDLGRRVSRETGSRPSNSPRRRSGSSSSRSSFTPLPRDGVMKQDSEDAEGQRTHEGPSAEYELDSGSQEDQSAKCQLDFWPQQDQYRLESGPQHDRYRRHSGSQEAESCDSSQQSASHFTYAPSVRPPPASVCPPASVMSSYPPAVLFPPLSSLPPPAMPHFPPGMFLPQQPPFFPSGPTFRNPPPLNLSFPNPTFANPPPLNPSFPNPPPLNPSFPNPPPLKQPPPNPTFSSPPPLNPTFSSPPPPNPTFPNPLFLNAANRAKAGPRQRCLQVIETKPG